MITQRSTKTTSLALVAITGLALSAPVLAGTATTYSVEQGAEEYVPIGGAKKKTKKDAAGDPILTVLAGDSVKFVWPADIGDTHDFAYEKGGKILWQSEPFATGATITIGPKSKNRDTKGKSLKKVISRPGTYKIYCTFHSGTMKMKLVVKKAPSR